MAKCFSDRFWRCFCKCFGKHGFRVTSLEYAGHSNTSDTGVVNFKILLDDFLDKRKGGHLHRNCFSNKQFHDIHSSRLTSSNFAAIVGFFRVNLLTETSCALSLASRRFLSVLSNASLVFCR